MSEEWGPWIDHDGKGCPVANGQEFEALLALELSSGGFLKDTFHGVMCQYLRDEWEKVDALSRRAASLGRASGIIRYRVRKPRALIALREMVENLPEREDA